METQRRVASGEIGEIVSAHIISNGGSLWVIKRQPGWSDMEYMLRNWANFCWLSGDHIVEQFIHEIDVMNWYIGKNPVKAMGGAEGSEELPATSMTFSVLNMFMTMACRHIVQPAR